LGAPASSFGFLGGQFRVDAVFNPLPVFCVAVSLAMLSVCAELTPPLESQSAVCAAAAMTPAIMEPSTVSSAVAGGGVTEATMFWDTMVCQPLGDCTLTSQVANDQYFVRPAMSGGLMADTDVSGTVVVTTEVANVALSVSVEKGGPC
jgi:hypothetical protein